jgi:hypothetical protein
MQRILERPITVWDACLTATCWLGLFYCQQYKTAGTCEKTVKELHDLNVQYPCEHHSYWFKSPHTGAIDQHALAEYEAIYPDGTDP